MTSSTFPPELEAILRESTPCSNCTNRRRCATQEVSCKPFTKYVHGDLKEDLGKSALCRVIVRDGSRKYAEDRDLPKKPNRREWVKLFILPIIREDYA